jgi:CheY-like chemotaxis protein
MTDSENAVWNVLLVEDDEEVRRQVREYFADETFASRNLRFTEIPDLREALGFIGERKADLVILDVYRGTAAPGGERTGVDVLESLKASGFAPVVLYTALPEGLEEHVSSFVRLVSKEADSLGRLKSEIQSLFDLRIPQLNRALINHLDQTLSEYMWRFVQEQWPEFEPLVGKPEFLRLVLQRLALTFSRQGVDRLTREVYETQSPTVSDSDTVHPAEYYIKPPLSEDPLLGDVRECDQDGGVTYLVVLWPSCDMVTTGSRAAKTQLVLCARASLARNETEISEWLESQTSRTKKDKVRRLIKNQRDKNFGSADRYHFLPGVWDIPDLVVDFQNLELVRIEELCSMRCLGTLASPFAEALGTRFRRYIGRPGTPDLDVSEVLRQLGMSPLGDNP